MPGRQDDFPCCRFGWGFRMNDKLLELAARRGALGARIAAQRETLALYARGIEPAFSAGDTLLRGVDWLKQHPGAVLAATATAVVMRPKRAWRWARRSFFVWRGWLALRRRLGDRP